MNFSAWAISRPIPSLLFFMLFTIAGLFGFQKLPIQHLPDLDFPTIVVTANLPGATPTTIENEVTQILENSLANVSGVKHMSSEISSGVSVTSITFNLEKPTLEASSDVRNAIEQVKNKLPSGMDDPTISRVTTSGEPLATFAVDASYMSDAELSWFVDNQITKAMLGLAGVGSIDRFGGIEREIRIELLPAELAKLGITAADVSAQLRQIIEEKPAGKVTLGEQEQSIRTLSDVHGKADIEQLPIFLPNGAVIRINQIATVIDGPGDPQQVAYVNGQESVTFQVSRARGYSEVDVLNRVREAVNTLNDTYDGLEITEVNNSVNPVKNNYDAAMATLYEGAALAVLAVWLFLRNIRATLVAAVALPLSIIPTFAVIAALGFQLNSITLLSLTLIIGVLVDDAIVEIENIERHIGNGVPPKKAALEAANEIGLAVIATSFTLIAVFLPTAFMTGLAGRFFQQFGWTASIAVFFSLLVARLLTPMMASYVMRATPDHKPAQGEGWLLSNYLKVVKASIRHPLITLFGAALFLVASFLLLMQLPTNFVDAEDREQVVVKVQTAPGSSLKQTASVSLQVSKLLQQYSEVTSVYAKVGGTNDINTAEIIAQLTSLKGPERLSQQAIEERLRQDMANIPGAKLLIAGGNSGQQRDIVLVGTSKEALDSAATSVIAQLRANPTIGAISTTAGLQKAEIVVLPDFIKAAELGISAAAISESTRIGFVSDYEQNLPKINLTERQLYIKTQFPISDRKELESLQNVMVKGANGLVPLSAVADFKVTGGPAKIERLDRMRSATISIDTQNKPLGDINKIVDSLPALQQLPAGVTQVVSGSAEQQQELFSGFGFAILAGILCVYAVLVLLFNDFLQPLTILLAIPLSAGGAFAALFLCGYSLSLSSMIGLIMLMGIVSKNSILLVEFAIMTHEELGISKVEAIIDACRKRARPIIMTSFAMIAGMLPMALQIGVPSAFRGPMAIAVIGGLITSTVLSLVVVPAAFIFVERIKLKGLHYLAYLRLARTPDPYTVSE